MSKPRFLGYLKHPITKQDKHNLRYQRNRERKEGKKRDRETVKSD